LPTPSAPTPNPFLSLFPLATLLARNQYHSIKREINENRIITGPPVELFAGGLAGVTCWTSCLPFDVVKTRIQSGGIGGEKRWLPTFLGIMKNDGPSALVAGFKPLVIRAFFVNAVTFYVFEECSRFLKS
jgi:hypothetical protein